MQIDLNRFAMGNVRPVLSFWASRRNYLDAIEALEQSHFSGWDQITQTLRLENTFQALNPSTQDKQQYINYVVTPRSLDRTSRLP